MSLGGICFLSDPGPSCPSRQILPPLFKPCCHTIFHLLCEPPLIWHNSQKNKYWSLVTIQDSKAHFKMLHMDLLKFSRSFIIVWRCCQCFSSGVWLSSSLLLWEETSQSSRRSLNWLQSQSLEKATSPDIAIKKEVGLQICWKRFVKLRNNSFYKYSNKCVRKACQRSEVLPWMFCAGCGDAGPESWAPCSVVSFSFFSDLALDVLICFSSIEGGWMDSI